MANGPTAFWFLPYATSLLAPQALLTGAAFGLGQTCALHIDLDVHDEARGM